MAATPVIGITTYVADARWGPWEQTAALVPLAGLILCGGPDLDPAVYGQGRIPVGAPLSPDRDGPELAPVRGARWSGRRLGATCHCSVSAGGCRCSTSPAAARFTSTCPTSSATTGTPRRPVTSTATPCGCRRARASDRSSEPGRPSCQAITRGSTSSGTG